MAEKQKAEVKEITREGGTPRVNWDDGNMKTTYANVCNVASTREEIAIFFGTNQSWKGMDEEVTVQLSDRVILSPFAAKRLANLLNNVLQQYESRFGQLDATPEVPKATAAN
jgi:hypothetical protein